MGLSQFGWWQCLFVVRLICSTSKHKKRVSVYNQEAVTGLKIDWVAAACPPILSCSYPLSLSLLSPTHSHIFTSLSRDFHSAPSPPHFDGNRRFTLVIMYPRQPRGICHLGGQSLDLILMVKNIQYIDTTWVLNETNKTRVTSCIHFNWVDLYD